MLAKEGHLIQECWLENGDGRDSKNDGPCFEYLKTILFVLDDFSASTLVPFLASWLEGIQLPVIESLEIGL